MFSRPCRVGLFRGFLTWNAEGPGLGLAELICVCSGTAKARFARGETEARGVWDPFPVSGSS